jgi:hypothetical protein
VRFSLAGLPESPLLIARPGDRKIKKILPKIGWFSGRKLLKPTPII